MAITTQGYDGVAHEIDEVGWAQITGFYGSSYGVAGVDGAPDESAGRVTVVSSAERTVAVAPVIAFGHGVRDRSDSTVNVQLPAVTVGLARWFLVAVRRDWQTNLTTISALPDAQTSAVIPSQRLTSPGVQDDQPLALVQVTGGQSIPTQVIDMRCWSGSGGVVAASEAALGYLTRLASQVRVGSTLWQRVLDANGTPTWSARADYHMVGSRVTVPGGGSALRTYQFPAGAFRQAPMVQVSIEGQTANSGYLSPSVGVRTKDSVTVIIRNSGNGEHFGNPLISAFEMG